MRGDFGGVIMEGRKILAIFLKVIFLCFLWGTFICWVKLGWRIFLDKSLGGEEKT